MDARVKGALVLWRVGAHGGDGVLSAAGAADPIAPLAATRLASRPGRRAQPRGRSPRPHTLHLRPVAEDAWQRINYPDGGEAQIAETVYGDRRLIVRRTRLLGPQAELWPDWRHFCVLTNRTDDIVLVEAEHREHAVVEQVIADLKVVMP